MNRPSINVTPLIDVLLVLLIIFMIVSPIKPSAFKTQIPSPPVDQPEISTNPDTLIVTIHSSGSISINREENIASVDDTAPISAKLKETFALRDASNAPLPAQRTVFVKAPKGFAYGKVVNVIDAVNASGASPVSLQIDQLD